MMKKLLHSIRLLSSAVAAIALWLSTQASAHDDNVVLLATTTSTENSGLLAELIPMAEQDTGYRFRVIAVGTGKAMALGRTGDVDVLMVHAEEAEIGFVNSGHGTERIEVMYNDFVIVGPGDDPAQIRTTRGVDEALKNISHGAALFVSRGDDSGTHKKELMLWASGGITPVGGWYREVGQGMGKTLQIADELQGYALTDRGTWIFNEDKFSLELLFENSPELFNQYSVIPINPDLHDINFRGARAFSEWIVGETAQTFIDNYTINGKKPFTANAGQRKPAPGVK